jgi:hypothetical protein
MPLVRTDIGAYDMRQEWMTAQANLAQAHATFQHAAAALPLQHRDLAGGCGAWTPKQVAAHLAGWDREAARALRALVAGAPEDFVIEIDVFNQASVDARAHLSWDSTCLDLRQAQASLQQAIGAIIDAPVSARGYLAWMEGRLADYELHTGQLRAWVPSEAKG